MIKWSVDVVKGLSNEKSNAKKIKGRQSRKGKNYGSFRILDKETGYKIAIDNKGSR